MRIARINSYINMIYLFILIISLHLQYSCENFIFGISPNAYYGVFHNIEIIRLYVPFYNLNIGIKLYLQKYHIGSITVFLLLSINLFQQFTLHYQQLYYSLFVILPVFFLNTIHQKKSTLYSCRIIIFVFCILCNS